MDTPAPKEPNRANPNPDALYQSTEELYRLVLDTVHTIETAQVSLRYATELIRHSTGHPDAQSAVAQTILAPFRALTNRWPPA